MGKVWYAILPYAYCILGKLGYMYLGVSVEDLGRVFGCISRFEVKVFNLGSGEMKDPHIVKIKHSLT